VLVLSGPLQSWGTRSRWNDRDSAPIPTLSGIAGLLACAQGHPRHDLPPWVAGMRLAVRSDDPGVTLTDYHTANAGYPLRPHDGHARKSSGGVHRPTVVTTRHYRADATFVAVAWHPDPAVASGWAQALRTPVWAPYLGRRSCPPALPPLLGTSDTDPLRLLRDVVPLLRHPPRGAESVTVLCTSASTTPATRVTDVPVSWDPRSRQFGSRAITEDLWDFPAQRCAGPGLDGWAAAATALTQDQPTDPEQAT
jgi:CRISPR system Cascade subunit CasD